MSKATPLLLVFELFCLKLFNRPWTKWKQLTMPYLVKRANVFRRSRGSYFSKKKKRCFLRRFNSQPQVGASFLNENFNKKSWLWFWLEHMRVSYEVMKHGVTKMNHTIASGGRVWKNNTLKLFIAMLKGTDVSPSLEVGRKVTALG